jgi:hypothetical protein
MKHFDLRILSACPLLVAACASGASTTAAQSFDDAGADAMADASSPSPDAPGDGSGNREAGSLVPPDASGLGQCPAPIKLTCSTTSFNQVVDCNGNVIMTCGADQGCENGRCVPACQSVARSDTSLGCEFYTHIPDTITYSGSVSSTPLFDGACFALMLANAWTADLSVEVDFGGQPIPSTNGFVDFTRIVKGSGSQVAYEELDATGKIHPGDVAVVFLASGDPAIMASNGFVSASFSCPHGVVPALVEPVAVAWAFGGPQTPNGSGFDIFAPDWTHGTQIRKTFHVKTSLPVSAVQMYPFSGGGSSSQIPGASMLLPVASWTKNYVTVDPAETFWNNLGADAWISIVPSAPDTHVTIRSTVDIPPFANYPGARAGVPFTYTLQPGQALEIAQGPEFAGAPISSDQPIGIFGGHECLILPSPATQATWTDFINGVSCDAAHAQIPPIANWASRYAEVPLLRSPSDQMMVRLVGAVDGTTLTYTPSAPQGSPTTLAKGQVADFLFSQAFVVASQDTEHPFYASTIMTNCEVSGTTGSTCGDPEFVNAVPPGEYMSQYTVFADPSYANTYLVVAQDKDTGYGDVSIDCLPGTDHTVPSSAWTEIPGGNIRYSIVPLRLNGSPSGACDAGVHVASGKSPFGAALWSIGDHTSIAYTPAVGTKTLTTVTVGVNQ